MGFIKKALSRAIKWVWAQIKEEFMEPITELRSEVAGQREEIKQMRADMQKAHQYDPAARECDLASLDDQICQQIERCSQRGYTTADERRRVTRLHDAYRARGGNHGEENEYAVFLTLPTQEEYERRKGA